MKRRNKKLVIVPVVLIAVIWAAASVLSGSPSGVYEGRVFVAGHGGHIADANVVINPGAAQPITIPKYLLWTGDKLHFIPLGEAADHAIHDVRVDSEDPNTIFWSTYTAKKPSVIVGKADLRTNKWIAEKTLDLPKEVRDFGRTEIKTLYCGSGQTEKYFMPVFMGYPGFIDVIDKNTLDLKQRVMLASNPELPVNYYYAHGVSSPDHKQFFLVMNDAEQPFAKATGTQHFYILDMAALTERGEIQILKRNTMPFPKGTISFRATYSPDGKTIMQAGRTRTLILKADDLSLIQEVSIPEGMENHDIVPTPDGRYGISTVRVPVEYEGAKVSDGQVWLYDVAANKYLGNPVSTCRSCHEKNEKHAPLTWGLKAAGCMRCHLDPKNNVHILGDNIHCGMDAVLTMK